MVVWIGLAVVYLLVGFYFEKPSDWKWHTRVLAHIFWLPIVIFLLFIVRFGGFKL